MSEIPKNAEKVEGVETGMPYLRAGKPFDGFVGLRAAVLKLAGFDFLAKLGDMMRAPGFKSTKPGVADRSWHKTGRAFDYDQGQVGKNAVIVLEQEAGRVVFRTFLRCQPGFEANGADISHLKQWVGGKGATVPCPAGAWIDFTYLAFQQNYHRIPAWKSWAAGPRTRYNTTMEFWHYQCDEGMSWAAAMDDLLKGSAAPAGPRVIGLNDRGDDVKLIQHDLVELGYLPPDQVDGTFDGPDHQAVAHLQAEHALHADGVVGPRTRAKIAELLKAA